MTELSINVWLIYTAFAIKWWILLKYTNLNLVLHFFASSYPIQNLTSAKGKTFISDNSFPQESSYLWRCSLVWIELIWSCNSFLTIMNLFSGKINISDEWETEKQDSIVRCLHWNSRHYLENVSIFSKVRGIQNPMQSYFTI